MPKPSDPMILCCGEALIDMLPCQAVGGEAAFTPHPGGAVFNTAVALGRLGERVGFFSGLSTDRFGDSLVTGLTGAGVDLTHARRRASPTTLAFVHLDGAQATYAFHDEGTAGRMLAPMDLPPEGAAGAWVFGGISLVNDPAAAVYEGLQARESARSVTMIDPNFRPPFVAAQEALRPGTRAEWEGRVARMIHRADIVKLSEDEASILSAGDVPGYVGALLAQGASLICVTHGAAGATAWTRGGMVTLPAPRITVVDTIGAGDTFNAGLLAGLSRAGRLTKAGLATLDVAEVTAALTLGIRAAAVTVSRPGANPPWKEEI